MRKSAIALLALLVVPLHAQAEPEVYAGSQFNATAVWTVRHGHRAITYVVFAGRQIDNDGGDLTYAAIARKACRLEGRNTSCPTKAIVRAIDQQAFEIDPLLSEVRLTVRQGKYVQTITWRGIGDYRPGYRYTYAGPPYWVTPIWAGAIVSNSRSAAAKGRLFGDRVRESDVEEASLGFNAAADVDSGP